VKSYVTEIVWSYEIWLLFAEEVTLAEVALAEVAL
jgi:hypothetical protein